MDTLLFAWYIGCFVGLSYPVWLGLVLAACTLPGPSFRPRPSQWLPLMAPGALYYALEYLVANRQEWNMPDALLGVSLFVTVVIVAARIMRRPGWLPAGSVLGMMVAIALWALVPHGGWSMP